MHTPLPLDAPLPRDALFLLPRPKRSMVATVVDGEIRPVALVSMSWRCRCASSEGGWFEAITKHSRRIWRGRVIRAGDFEVSSPLVLPEGVKALDVVCLGEVVLVGGRGRQGTVLLGTRLGQATPEWWEVEVPEELRSHRKGFDRLVARDGTMFAVDDVITPKWVARYDVADPQRPRLLSVDRLPCNKSYEQVFDAALGSRFLATLSAWRKGGFRFSYGRRLWIMDKEQLFPYGLIEQEASFDFLDESASLEESVPLDGPFREIAFVGDTLVVACGKRGLMVIPLDGLVPDEEPKLPWPERFDSLEEEFRHKHKDMAKRAEWRARWQEAIEGRRRFIGFTEGAVVGVRVVPGCSKAVVVVKRVVKLDHVVNELSDGVQLSPWHLFMVFPHSQS